MKIPINLAASTEETSRICKRSREAASRTCNKPWCFNSSNSSNLRSSFRFSSSSKCSCKTTRRIWGQQEAQPISQCLGSRVARFRSGGLRHHQPRRLRQSMAMPGSHRRRRWMTTPCHRPQSDLRIHGHGYRLVQVGANALAESGGRPSTAVVARAGANRMACLCTFLAGHPLNGVQCMLSLFFAVNG